MLINGKTVDQVSASDRGLMYGHGLFETIAVDRFTPCLLELHLQRLLNGAARLNIPLDKAALISDIEQLCEQNERGVLRINVTAGTGGRGYLSPDPITPTRILSFHDLPLYPSSYWQQGIHLGLADIRLSHQPALAGMKHNNRLEQVIARSQWQPHWQEALLLDQEGCVIEGTQSNVFIVKGGELRTPELSKAGVAGVMRSYVMSLAESIEAEVKIMPLSLPDIEQADAVFMTGSLIGVWPVKCFNTTSYNNSEIINKLLNLIIKNEVIPTY